MGIDVLAGLGGRLRTVENRAHALEASLAAFAATVSDLLITEQALRGLGQIAKELADDLEGHSPGMIGVIELPTLPQDCYLTRSETVRDSNAYQIPLDDISPVIADLTLHRASGFKVRKPFS
jgi:hypothetical protein